MTPRATAHFDKTLNYVGPNSRTVTVSSKLTKQWFISDKTVFINKLSIFLSFGEFSESGSLLRIVLTVLTRDTANDTAVTPLMTRTGWMAHVLKRKEAW